MRIAELSARSGLPIPTIKFYRREGLLPPGRPIRTNQVEYATSHVFRLRLIRALTEVGGLSLPSVRTLLDAVDDPARVPAEALAATTKVPVNGRRNGARDDRWRAARKHVIHLLTMNGWRMRRNAEGFDTVADVLACLRDLDHEIPADLLTGYIRLARATVAAEMRLVRALPPGTIPTPVQVAIFYEKLFAALRRLAREDWWASHGLLITAEPPMTPRIGRTQKRPRRTDPACQAGR